MSDKEIPIELVATKILLARGRKVMLDKDLAGLYGVETFNLNKAVKRNIDRFPEDFMFQLNNKEYEDLRSQIVTTKELSKRRTLPYAFTEHGILMLSSVLNSKKAIQVNVQVMRVFIKMRELLTSQIELARKLAIIEKFGKENTKDIKEIWNAIRELYGFQSKDKNKKIGFD